MFLLEDEFFTILTKELTEINGSKFFRASIKFPFSPFENANLYSIFELRIFKFSKSIDLIYEIPIKNNFYQNNVINYNPVIKNFNFKINISDEKLVKLEYDLDKITDKNMKVYFRKIGEIYSDGYNEEKISFGKNYGLGDCKLLGYLYYNDKIEGRLMDKWEKLETDIYVQANVSSGTFEIMRGDYVFTVNDITDTEILERSVRLRYFSKYVSFGREYPQPIPDIFTAERKCRGDARENGRPNCHDCKHDLHKIHPKENQIFQLNHKYAKAIFKKVKEIGKVT